MPAPAWLQEEIFIEGAVDLQVLERALEELAARLARRLEEEGQAYREIQLEVETEGGKQTLGRRFPYLQEVAGLRTRLAGLLRRAAISAPVERLSVRVGGLAPAPVRQLVLFGSGPPASAPRFPRLPEPGFGPSPPILRASHLEEERREKMLAFYDPFRQRRAGGRGPAA
ncbi:MAG: hypothetical protein ACPLPT_05005 [Moorellales bacterium]